MLVVLSGALAKELNIAPGLPDLTDDDIADYLGNNAARLLQLDASIRIRHS